MFRIFVAITFALTSALHSAEDKIEWVSDYAEAIKQAKKTDQKVFIVFNSMHPLLKI